MHQNRPTKALRYRLAPDPEAAEAIEATFEAYHRMMDILDDVAPAEKGANLVLLHGIAYDRIRDQTGLPARLVTMGLGDRADYRAAGSPRLPLDEKIFNVKNATTVTVSTVRGRVTVPYDVAGYLPGWGHRAQAHLVRRDDGGFEIHVGVTPNIPEQENDMTQAASESILTRAGRLIAGIAHEVIDVAEGKNRQAVVKRAIAEIEAAEGEARAELARERGAEWRLNARRTEIETELKALQAQLDTALASGRDDLAKAGISRQLDLEAQLQVVDSAMGETRERIGIAMTAIAATESALEEAQARLSDLQRSEAAATAANPVSAGSAVLGGDAARKAARASRAVSRVVGVPASPAKPRELDELSRLHREREVESRLVRMKSEKGAD